MRKLLLALLAAGLAALAFVVYSATGAFESRVAAAVEDLKREVAQRRYVLHVEDVDTTWLPRPKVVLEKAKVTTREKKGDLIVFETDRVVVYPSAASLLDAPKGIERVVLENPRFITRTVDNESVMLLMPVAHAMTLPVELRGGVVRIERGADFPAIEIENIDVELVPRDGAIDFSGTVSPLGDRSHGDVKGIWRPGAGRTGGDGLEISLDLSDGDPAALETFVPQLERATFTDDVTLKLEAKGFVGERGTETLPADPLAGRLRAEVGLDLLGLDRRVVFDSGVSLDDKRWMLHDGDGKWGEREFSFAGWVARAAGANKVNLRMSFKDISVPDVLADYGIEERWRPDAVVTGEIRMGGSFDYPLTRYEAKAPRVTFAGWPSTPISTGPTIVRGSLLAINAEVSGSFETSELNVGHVKIDDALVGSRWWREKLTLTSLGLPLWGGKVDASAAYEPDAERRYMGGALLRDMDAAEFAKHVLPDSGLKLDGRLDVSMQADWRDGRLWLDGRVGVHDGTLGPKGLLRSILDDVAASAGAEPGVVEELAQRHPVLAADAMPFRRLAADFQSAKEDVAVRVADLMSEGATLSLDGTVSTDRRLSTAGIVTLTPPLTSDLVRRIAALGALVAGDDTMQVPVRVEGTPGDLRATVDARFTEALRAARAGKDVEPVATELPEPSFTTDLPPLEEQFGR